MSNTHNLCRERDSKGVKAIAWSAIERLHLSEADRVLDRFEGQVCRDQTGRMHVNTLRTGDADLRFYITTVQDG